MRRKPPRLGAPAFGAGELFRIENDSGAVVAQLSVGESEFWVADESARHPAKTAPPLSGAQESQPRVAGCTSEALTSFLNLAHPDCLSNSAL